MNKLRIAEFFGGIGASSEALHNVYGKDNIEIVDYVELDKHATNAYNAINETKFLPRDINDVDVNAYGELDLLIAGWPCTSLSNAGKQKGMGTVVEKFYEYPTLENIKNWYNKSNSDGTYGEFIGEYPSGLIYTTISKLMDMDIKPKRILLENVKGLLSKKFEKDLELVKSLFKELGYKWQHVLLNSKYFDVPQSRERVFIMLTRNDIQENEIVSLKDRNEVTKVQSDILDFTQETFKIKLDKTNTERVLFVEKEDATFNSNNKAIKIELDKLDNQNRDQINKVGGLGKLIDGEFKDMSFNQDKTFFGIDGQTQTLVASNPMLKNKIIYKKDGEIHFRKLSALETWRFMGFSDESFNRAGTLTSETKGGKVKRVVSDSQLAKQAGNSIVVNIIEEILKKTFK